MNKVKLLMKVSLCFILFSCNFNKNTQSRNIEDFYINTLGFDIEQETALHSVVNRTIFITFLIAIDTLECNVYPRFVEKITNQDIIENLSKVHGVALSGNDTTIVYDAEDLAYFNYLINYNKGEPVSEFASEILGRKFTEEIGDLNIAIGPPLLDGKNMLIYISYHIMRKEEDGSFTHENVFLAHHVQDISSPHGLFAKIPIVADWTNEWFSVE